MIRIIVLYILLHTTMIPWASGAVRAYMQDDLDAVMSHLEDAIESGQANKIVQRAGAYVEVSILGNGTLYSRSQTTYILKAFFKKHPPKRFAFQRRMHVGDDWYMYGTYWDAVDRQTYRLELRMRRTGSGYEIKNIRIS